MKYKLKSSLLITFFLITNLCYGQLTTTAVQDTQNVSDGDSTTTTTTTTTATTDAATPDKDDGVILQNTSSCTNMLANVAENNSCSFGETVQCSLQPNHNFQSAHNFLTTNLPNIFYFPGENPNETSLVEYKSAQGNFHQRIRFDQSSVKALFNNRHIALSEKMNASLSDQRSISLNYINSAINNADIKPPKNSYDIPLLAPNQDYTKALLANYYMRLNDQDLKTAVNKGLVGDCRLRGKTNLTLDLSADIACNRFLLTKSTTQSGSWQSNIRCFPKDINPLDSFTTGVGCYHGMREEVCNKTGEQQELAFLQDAITTSLDPSGQDLCNFTAMANELNALKNAPKMTIESIVSDANIKFKEANNGQIECFLKLSKDLVDKIPASYKYTSGGADYIPLRSDMCTTAFFRVAKAAYTDSLANIGAVPMLEPLEPDAQQVVNSWNSNTTYAMNAQLIEMIPYNPDSVTREVFFNEHKTIPSQLSMEALTNSRIHVYKSNVTLTQSQCIYDTNPYPYSSGSFQGCSCVSSTATPNQAVE